MQVLTKGATSINVGQIQATADTDATVTAMIIAGQGQTHMCIYGIPSTQKLYISRYFASAIKDAAGTSVEIDVVVNPEPDVELLNFRTQHIIGIDEDGSTYAEHVFGSPIKVTGPAIVKIQCDASANNSLVSGGFDAYVVDN